MASKTIEEPPYSAATAQLHQLLQNRSVSEALAILERGTAKQGYYHEIDYSRGSDHYRKLDKSLFQFGGLSIILCATARQLAAEGDHETAWSTAIANLRFANARIDDPEPITHLYRQIQARLAMSSIRAIAAQNAPSDQEYKEIESLLKGFEDNAPLVRQQDAERLLEDDQIWTQPFSKLRSELQIGKSAKTGLMTEGQNPRIGITR